MEITQLVCPFIFIGTEFYYKQGDNSWVYQTLKLGGIYNKFNISALIIKIEFSYRYTLNSGSFADGHFGIGYSHNFRSQAIYKADKNGKYQKKVDWGQPRLIADITGSLGHNFNKKDIFPAEFSLGYGIYAHLFYCPDIPALPQNIVHLGTKYYNK